MGRNEGDKRVKRRGFCVGFVVSVVILVGTSVGLRSGLSALSRHYTKESVAPRRPLRDFDVSKLSSLDEEWKCTIEETWQEIETEEYALVEIRNRNAGRGVRSGYLMATYYSDPRSKVPHSPDVCYRQFGAAVKKKKEIALDVPGIEGGSVRATLLVLGMDGGDRVVIYLFVAEGKYCTTRGQVRWVLGTPGNRYTYFSKIEASAALPKGGDPTEAIEFSKALLRDSIAVLVNRYLPDKNRLRGG